MNKHLVPKQVTQTNGTTLLVPSFLAVTVSKKNPVPSPLNEIYFCKKLLSGEVGVWI